MWTVVRTKKSFNTAIPVRSLGPYMYVHYCTCIVHILVSTYLILLTSFFDCLSFCGLFLKHPYKRFFPFYILYFYQSRSLSLSLSLSLTLSFSQLSFLSLYCFLALTFHTLFSPLSLASLQVQIQTLSVAGLRFLLLCLSAARCLATSSISTENTFK